MREIIELDRGSPRTLKANNNAEMNDIRKKEIIDEISRSSKKQNEGEEGEARHTIAIAVKELEDLLEVGDLLLCELLRHFLCFASSSSFFS